MPAPLSGSGAAAAKFRENIEDRNRQSLIFGVLPLSFFAFWPNFSPAAWSFRRRKEQPYFVLKKFPAVFDALLPFFCCKNATAHPDFFFL
jgi:hypothetical protein